MNPFGDLQGEIQESKLNCEDSGYERDCQGLCQTDKRLFDWQIGKRVSFCLWHKVVLGVHCCSVFQLVNR